MRSRRRRPDPACDVENVAARLRRTLAQPGPHDARIGSHRTFEGNVDPTRTRLALVGRRRAETAAREPLAAPLDDDRGSPRLLARPAPVAALRAAKQVGRRWLAGLRWLAVP